MMSFQRTFAIFINENFLLNNFYACPVDSMGVTWLIVILGRRHRLRCNEASTYINCWRNRSDVHV